jgi:Tfp pilus assembly protein PilF
LSDVIVAIQRNFSLGSRVRIHLTSGQLLDGELIELALNYIKLRTAQGDAMLFAPMLGGVESTGDESSVSASRAAMPVQNGEYQRPLPDVPRTVPSLPEPIAIHSQVPPQATEIALRVKRAMASANLGCFPPIGQVTDERMRDLYLAYGSRLEIKAEFDRSRQQWGNWERGGDSSQMGILVSRMQPIARRHPKIWEARYNLGCYFVRMENPKAATAEFLRAAILGQSSEAWHNAGATAWIRRQWALAHVTLGRFFSAKPPTSAPEAWNGFVQAMHETRVYTPLGAIFEKAVKEEAEDVATKVLDAAIFAALEEQAVSAVESLLGAKLKTPRPKEVVRDALIGIGRGELEPVLELLEIEKELAAERANREAQIALSRPSQPTRARSTTERSRALQPAPGPPVGNVLQGYYAAGRLAWERKELDKAEELLWLAVKTEDSLPSAVKDLASLLHQRGRSDSAQEVLRDYSHRIPDQLPLANLQGFIELHRNNYEEAIPFLQRAAELSPSHRKATALKNLANACYRAQRYDDSEKHARASLKYAPSDPDALRLLSNAIEARQSGRVGVEVAFDEDVVEKGGRSVFLELQLESCEYFNVPPSKVQDRTFTMEDVRKLKGLIESAGSKRFRERAGTHLARAKMMTDLNQGEPSEVEVELRQYCGFMGDLALQNDLHVDVARSYYSEAFGVPLGWADPPQLRARQGLEWNGNRRLSQWLMLLYAQKSDILNDTLPHYEKVLEYCLKEPRLRLKAIEGLLRLSLTNGALRSKILDPSRQNHSLRQLAVAALSDYLGPTPGPRAEPDQLWDTARRHLSEQWQRAQAQLAYLQQLAGNLESSSQQAETIRQLIASEFREGFDQSRLNELLGILEQIGDYYRESLYIERERLHDLLDQRLSQLLAHYRDRPTQATLEFFKPYLEKLRDTLQVHFQRVQEAAEPDKLETALVIESYSPDPFSGRVECQIEVKNPPGKSPASAVTLEVLPSREGHYTAEQRIVEETSTIQGGTRRTIKVPLQLTPAGLACEIVPLSWRVSFSSRMQRQYVVENQKDSIRLYAADRFEKFDNPYSSLVGKIATDRKYFYGRWELIETLKDAILNSPSGKSHVIYGQKRAGKSSVLYHLQRAFSDPAVPIGFSIYSQLEMTLPGFLYLIAHGIDQDLSKREVAQDRPACPPLSALRQDCEIVFQEYLDAAVQFYTAKVFGRRPYLILMLDEFSHLYSQIVKNKLPREFMKYWKSLIEQSNFSAVLVGQDTMPYFIDSFRNEFQLGLRKRISYLEETDALHLIEEPIMIRNAQGEVCESRYKSEAAQRVFEYTFGSPFFTHTFCNELVQYMHERRAAYVSDVDIDRVKELLVRGERCLRLADFDCLLTTGDADMNTFEEVKVVAVLSAVAAETKHYQEYCDRTRVLPTGVSTDEVDNILADLLKREVLQEQGSGKYRIRLRLFREWLNANT